MKNFRTISIAFVFAALFALSAITTNAQTAQRPTFVPAGYAGDVSWGRVAIPASAGYPDHLTKEDLAAMKPTEIYRGTATKVYDLPSGHNFETVTPTERYISLVEYDKDFIKGEVWHTEPFEVKVDVIVAGTRRLKTTKACFVIKEANTSFTAEKVGDSLAPYADAGCNNPFLAIGIPPARFVGMNGGGGYSGGGNQQAQQQQQQMQQQQQAQQQQQSQQQSQSQEKKGRGFDKRDALEIIGGAIIGGVADHVIFKRGNNSNIAIANARSKVVNRRKVINNYPPVATMPPPKIDPGSPSGAPIRMGRGGAALSRGYNPGNSFAQSRPSNNGGVALTSIFRGGVIERVTGRAVSGNAIPTSYSRSNAQPLRSSSTQQRVIAGSFNNQPRTQQMAALFGRRQ